MQSNKEYFIDEWRDVLMPKFFFLWILTTTGILQVLLYLSHYAIFCLPIVSIIYAKISGLKHFWSFFNIKKGIGLVVCYVFDNPKTTILNKCCQKWDQSFKYFVCPVVLHSVLYFPFVTSNYEIYVKKKIHSNMEQIKKLHLANRWVDMDLIILLGLLWLEKDFDAKYDETTKRFLIFFAETLWNLKLQGVALLLIWLKHLSIFQLL